jgi:uncharacterized protein YprB with RNaseH-like and TPR domain
MKKITKKRLFFDIETSYNIGSFWSLGKQYISYQNIIHERAIICICYKWENEKTVKSLNWDINQCDKKMLQDFLKVVNDADELVTQNGDNFDIKWLRTRCIKHGIPMFPSYTSLDTYKKAKSGFKFNSNSLDYMGMFLGLGKKDKVALSDWNDIILRKDKKALEKMIKYCKQDVLLLEQVYNKLSPYITPKTHFGALNGLGSMSCPECGSLNMKLSKTRVTSLGTKRYQLQCGNCGKYHTVSETTYNKSN